VTGRAGGRAWRAVPLTLALAMLAVVVFAGLLPDTGVVSASSSCTYGKCPAAQPFPLWAVGASIGVVIVALLVALLLLRRSRRRPPAEGTEPPAGSTQSTGTDGKSTWTEDDASGGSQNWSEQDHGASDAEADDASGSS
jgi:hypothetical protein